MIGEDAVAVVVFGDILLRSESLTSRPSARLSLRIFWVYTIVAFSAVRRW